MCYIGPAQMINLQHNIWKNKMILLNGRRQDASMSICLKAWVWLSGYYRLLDLWSGGPAFKSSSLPNMDLFSVWCSKIQLLHALYTVNYKLVSFPPVGMFGNFLFNSQYLIACFSFPSCCSTAVLNYFDSTIKWCIFQFFWVLPILVDSVYVSHNPTVREAIDIFYKLCL